MTQRFGAAPIRDDGGNGRTGNVARGEPTAESKIAKFRAHYLYSGNASKSARELKLPESTGRDLAQELSADPTFVEARRKLRDQYLDELVAARMRVVDKAMERFEGELEAPASLGEDAMVTIIDKRADYGKLVLDAEKNAHNLAKLGVGDDGSNAGTTEVHIHLAADDDGSEKT